MNSAKVVVSFDKWRSLALHAVGLSLSDQFWLQPEHCNCMLCERAPLLFRKGQSKRGVALGRPAAGVAGRPSSLWLLGGYQLFFAVLLLLIFRIWLTHQNGSCECGGSPGEIVAKRFCLNFNRGAGSFAVIPVANAKLAGYQNPLTLRNGACRVNCQLAKSGDCEPIGFAIDPLVCGAVESAVRGR